MRVELKHAKFQQCSARGTFSNLWVNGLANEKLVWPYLTNQCDS